MNLDRKKLNEIRQRLEIESRSYSCIQDRVEARQWYSTDVEYLLGLIDELTSTQAGEAKPIPLSVRCEDVSSGEPKRPQMWWNDDKESA